MRTQSQVFQRARPGGCRIERSIFVDGAAVTDGDDEDDEFGLLKLANDAEVKEAVTPQTKLAVAKRFAERSRIIGIGDALVHIVQNFTLNLPVELFEVFDGSSSYSIVQAKLPPNLGAGKGLAALFEAGFGEVAVFEVFDVFLDELDSVKSLGAAGLCG